MTAFDVFVQFLLLERTGAAVGTLELSRFPLVNHLSGRIPDFISRYFPVVLVEF
jgi:hypothetical protein